MYRPAYSHPGFSRPGRVSVAVAAQPVEFGRADLGADLEFPAPDWALIGIDELGDSGESAALEHLGRRVFLGEGVSGDGPKTCPASAFDELSYDCRCDPRRCREGATA